MVLLNTHSLIDQIPKGTENLYILEDRYNWKVISQWISGISVVSFFQHSKVLKFVNLSVQNYNLLWSPIVMFFSLTVQEQFKRIGMRQYGWWMGGVCGWLVKTWLYCIGGDGACIKTLGYLWMACLFVYTHNYKWVSLLVSCFLVGRFVLSVRHKCKEASCKEERSESAETGPQVSMKWMWLQ